MAVPKTIYVNKFFMCVAILSLPHAIFVVITIYEYYCTCAVYSLESKYQKFCLSTLVVYQHQDTMLIYEPCQWNPGKRTYVCTRTHFPCHVHASNKIMEVALCRVRMFFFLLTATVRKNTDRSTGLRVLKKLYKKSYYVVTLQLYK